MARQSALWRIILATYVEVAECGFLNAWPPPEQPQRPSAAWQAVLGVLASIMLHWHPFQLADHVRLGGSAELRAGCMLREQATNGPMRLQPPLVEIGGVAVCHRLRLVAFGEDHDVVGAYVARRVEVPVPVNYPWATEDPVGIPVAVIPEADIVHAT